MSDRVLNHGERRPRSRLEAPAEAVFFPGEVVRLLDLGPIEYAQLRHLYRLARTTRGLPSPDRRWSRFTLADLASVEVLIKLGNGREALNQGRRLVLGDVELACDVLRSGGIPNPLLDVPLARVGRRLLARVDGYVFEPTTGQMVLEDVTRQMQAFLDQRLIRDAAVVRAIKDERRRLRRGRQATAGVNRQLGHLMESG